MEALLKKQVTFINYQYNCLYESVTNKEAQESFLKAKVQEQDEIRSAREEMYFNLRLWLLESFVRINQWDMVDDVIGRAWGYRYDATIHRPVLIAMFEALEWCIRPLH